MNSNAFTAADMSTAAANGHHDGYQAGYADAVKAFDAAQPAAAQEAVAWSKTKPTAEGAYYVRGFNLFQLAQYEALVQVRTHHFDGEPAPELVCNIHESTSNADKDDWSPIVEMSEDFEWLGPLVVAPAAAAPDVPNEADWMVACSEIVGPDVAEEITTRAYSVAELPRSTPAAPGIDHLRSVINALSRSISDTYEKACQNGDERMQTVQNARQSLLNTIREAMPLIDASPKGGSTDAKDAARWRFLRDNNGVRNHLAVEVFIDGEAFGPGHLDAQVDEAMQGDTEECKACDDTGITQNDEHVNVFCTCPLGLASSGKATSAEVGA